MKKQVILGYIVRDSEHGIGKLGKIPERGRSGLRCDISTLIVQNVPFSLYYLI